MSDLVEPIPKTGVKSTQAQRRRQWQKDYETAQEIVSARSKGWCEVRGCDRKATQTHHKKGRIVPDANDPENLLDVCDECHLRIEEGDRAWAYERGYLLRRT